MAEGATITGKVDKKNMSLALKFAAKQFFKMELSF